MDLFDEQEEEKEQKRAKIDYSTEIEGLIEELNSFDPKEQMNSISKIRKLLSKEINPPIKEIINSGCVPRIGFIFHKILNFFKE
jgi:hypothetical protein